MFLWLSRKLIVLGLWPLEVGLFFVFKEVGFLSQSHMFKKHSFFFFWQKVRKDLCFEVSTEQSTTYKFLKAALKIVCSIHYGAVLLIDSLRDPTTWLWR